MLCVPQNLFLTHSFQLNRHPCTLTHLFTVHTISVCCPSTVRPMWRGSCSQRQHSTQVNIIHMSTACHVLTHCSCAQVKQSPEPICSPLVLSEQELQAFPLLQLSLIEPIETHPGLCCHAHHTTCCHTPNYSLSPKEDGCLSRVHRKDTAAVTSKPHDILLPP